MRYFHTLRFLKSSQIGWRLWYRLYKSSPSVSNDLSVREQVNPLCHTITKLNPCVDEGVAFLNKTVCQPWQQLWHATDHELLWLYHLHYMDVVNSGIQLEQQKQWIEHWIDHNPATEGVGWQPYPTSLRIINWVKCFLKDGTLASKSFHQSLRLQAQYLYQRIEYHILANHLFTNAKALVFAGLYFDDREANRWLEKGLKLLEAELSEQILSDGAHFELSPMYHAIVLEDCLDLINLFQCYQASCADSVYQKIIRCLPKMFAWLKKMTHPDGDISFFNDATLGVAPTLLTLQEYADRLKTDTINNTDEDSHASGYYRLEQDCAVVILDAGHIGPNYQPGHAHADTLSFEMSLGQQRLLVNSGISCYGKSVERIRQRGGSAHNTATVADQNSSDVWSGFRVGRRTQVEVLDTVTDSAGRCVKAKQSYHIKVGKDQQRKVVHQRTWQLQSGVLNIVDQFKNTTHYPIQLFFHFHPLIEVSRESDRIFLLRYNGEQKARMMTEFPAHIQASHYYPGFSTAESNQLLVVSFDASVSDSTTTTIQWSECR